MSRAKAAVLISACGLYLGASVAAPQFDSLPPCPSAPHCVSSLAQDAEHRIEPLRYAGPREAAHARLLRALAQLPRTRVVVDQIDYVRAEATSRWLHFVDDLEFALPEALPGADGVIEMRSASRSGYYDFGVNRRRLEKLRAAFAATGP